MIDPYPFQAKILEQIRQSFRDGYTAPLIVSPTGSGKTIIFAVMAHLAVEKGSRTLILVHRDKIMQQTLKKLNQVGIQAGQVASGKPMTRDLVQVGMVGSIKNRIHLMQKPDIITTDEAHHCGAPTWMNIYKQFPDVLKPCFTATPELASGRGMGIGQGGICDCMIKGPSTNWAVEQGYLAYPYMKSPDKAESEKYHIKRGDYDKDEQVKAMTKKNIVGDVIDHYKQYLDGLPTIVSCVSIKHCYLMAEYYNQYARETGKSWKAVVVQGGTKYKKELEDGLSGLENGSVQLVMFCDVISEGVDVPLIMGVQNLRRTQSLALILQIWGRALRAVYADGYNLKTQDGRLQAIARSIKPHAMILDHAGNFHIHGHPLDERQWSLNEKPRSERKSDPPTTTKCPKCKGTWPGKPKKCMGFLSDGSPCGHIFSDIDNTTTELRKIPKIIPGDLIAALPGADQRTINEITQNWSQISEMTPSVRQKYILNLAFRLGNQPNGRSKIAALGAAVNYHHGWGNHVWFNVLKKRR